MPKNKNPKRTARGSMKSAGVTRKATKRKQQSSDEEEQRVSKKQAQEEEVPKSKNPRSLTEGNRKSTGAKKKATERKQQKSVDCADQNPSQSKPIRATKTSVYKPLAASVMEHIQSCIETAMLSVLSKKLSDRQTIQEHFRGLKQRLFHHCKNIKAPSTKLGNLKCLLRDLSEEQHRMEANEETLRSLEEELQKATETMHKIEEEIEPLQEKINALQQELIDEQPEVSHSSSEVLQLPKASFQAPTLQESVRSLKNPQLLLKELCLLESTPAAINMRKLIERAYAEIEPL